MNLEELKGVDLTTLENVQEHIKTITSLEKDDKYNYLKYAVDTYYKTEEEGENNMTVVEFFAEESFKPVYELLMKASETTEDTTEDTAEEK